MSQAREIHKIPPPELWVVWAEGKYRIYWSAKTALNYFDRFVKKNIKVEMLRYEMKGVESGFEPVVKELDGEQSTHPV